MNHLELLYDSMVLVFLLGLVVLLLFGVLGFNFSRSVLIRSSNRDAGSSLGSWGTSSPRKALTRID